MSFTKTISTVAALASIFGAAAAGWKLAESNSPQPPTVLDQKLNELDKKLEDLSKPVLEPAPVVVPETPPKATTLPPAPQQTMLPPVAPPPPPQVTTETQQ